MRRKIKNFEYVDCEILIFKVVRNSNKQFQLLESTKRKYTKFGFVKDHSTKTNKYFIYYKVSSKNQLHASLQNFQQQFNKV